ncbi:MAG TPA: hypothetical protein VMU94_17530 [Streptosporangiaceae bacterium]|nr:hypothetical protein [Streptosporangiaceae bacterium]
MGNQVLSGSADQGELLVVDDEPFLRDAVAASLRFLGLPAGLAARRVREVAAGDGADTMAIPRTPARG